MKLPPLPVPLTQHRLPAFARFLWRRFDELNITQVAASLTFTTLLALVPFLTITVVVIAAFPVFSNITAAFQDFISATLMPEASGKIINEYIYGFREQTANLTTIGIIALMVSAVLLIMTIERTFNHIWRVSRPRPLWTRLLVYWAILTLGPLGIGLGMSTWALLFKQTGFALTHPLWAHAVHWLMSIVFSTGLLFLLYKVVPYRYVPTQHALLGAFITALVLELVRRAFGLYVANFNSYELIYGAFAAIPIFLLWIDCLWFILLAGAVLTAGFSYWRGEAFRRELDKGGRFDDVLKILLLLNEAQNNGQAVPVQVLRQHINMGFDELGDLLEKLAERGYVYSGDHGWSLKTNAPNIHLADLFKLFVYQPSDNNDDRVGQTIQEIMQPSLASMHMTLADFVEHTRHDAQPGDL